MKLKRIQRLIGNRPTDEAVFAKRHFLQPSGKINAAELLKGTTNYSVYGRGPEAKTTLMSPVSHELLSMIMYAIEFNPLLTILAEGLQGLKTKPASSKLSVFAYAEGITIILASPADIEADRIAVRLYCTNVLQLPTEPYQIQSPITGQMNSEIDSMGIPYLTATTVLGIRFHATIADTTRCPWSCLVTHTRHSRCSARLRDLNLLQRVRYVSIFQFSRLRYHTQVLPVPDEELCRVNRATT
jgi:hypothetical protein